MLSMHRYRLPPVHTNYVCFVCRLKIRYSKYGGQNAAPRCPECGGFAEHIGDRHAHVPPRQKIAAWKQLEQAYRSCQQEIADYYRHYRTRLQLDLQNHQRLAETRGLSEVAATDQLLLQMVAALPEVPFACRHPFYCDWRRRFRQQVSHSDIDNPKAEINRQIAALQALPYNKERQKALQELILKKNRLRIYDPLHLFNWHACRDQGIDYYATFCW